MIPRIPICKFSRSKREIVERRNRNCLLQRRVRRQQPENGGQQTNFVTLRKQIADATEKMRAASERAHCLVTGPDRFARGRAGQSSEVVDRGSRRSATGSANCSATSPSAPMSLTPGRDGRAGEVEEQADISDMTVLDKASPPVDPAFPKPFVVMPVGIAAGLALGLVLALLAEAADRRVRFPIDLEHAARALLGALGGAGRAKRGVKPQPSTRLSAVGVRVFTVVWHGANQCQGPGTVQKTIGGNVCCERRRSGGPVEWLRASVHGA